MFTNDDLNTLIKVMKQVATSECIRVMKQNNVETIMYGVVTATDNTGYTVQIAGGEKPYTGLKNKSSDTIVVGDSVIVKAINGNAGNGYIAVKMGASGEPVTPDRVPWGNVTNTPTTISGYGITDAKIEGDVVTLGGNTITPLTSATTPIKSVNGKTGVVSLGASDVGAVPTSRTINGKALTSNITLTASDVGALSTSQIASANALGAVKVGDGLAIKTDGTLYATGSSQSNTVTYIIKSSQIATSAWVENTNSQATAKEKEDYPYMATISITSPSVATDDVALVAFGYDEQALGIFSPNCYTTANGVIIESKKIPAGTITLDYIRIERTIT